MKPDQLSEGVVRVLGWVVGFLVAGYVVSVLRAPSGGPEIEDILQHGVDSAHAQIVVEVQREFADSAMELPKFLALAEESQSLEEAQRASLTFTYLGVPRLPSSLIDSLAHLRYQFLGELDEETCARISRNQLLPDEIYPLLAQLDTARLRAFMEISSRASLAYLSSPDLPVPPTDSLDQAWGAFTQTLDSAELQRFIDFSEVSLFAEDAEMCWAERVLWRAVPKMSHTEKTVLIRGLTTELDSGSPAGG